MSMWQPQTIEVRATKGVRMVDAQVFGCFAVHRRIAGSAAWAVTHLPTGLALSNVLNDFSSVDAAKRSAEVLARRFNSAAEWGCDCEDEHRDLSRTVRTFVVEHGLKGDAEPVVGRAPSERPRLNGYQASVQ